MSNGRRTYSPIRKAADGARRVLSFQQERLHYLARLAPGNTYWNRLSCKRILGSLDAAALAGAVRDLCARHAILTERVAVTCEGPVLESAPRARDEALAIVDLSGAARVDALRAARDFLDGHLRDPIDPARGPLFEAFLARLGEREHLVLLKMHHVASDDATFRILWRDLKLFYNARVGRGEPPPPLALSYHDYAIWQRSELREGATQAEEEYWVERLGGERPTPALPVRFARTPDPGFEGAVARMAPDRALLRRLEALSLANRTPLFSTLLAVWLLLLRKYSGETDVTTGTVFAGRHYAPALKDLAGFFVTTVALRAQAEDDASFSEFVRHVHDRVQEAYAMQDGPLDRIARRVGVQRESGRNPLFNTIFNLLTRYRDRVRFEGTEREEWVRQDVNATQVDLALEIEIGPDDAELRLEYATGLFERGVAERLLRHYANLLRAVAERPDAKLASLRVMDDDEVREWLAVCHGPARAFDEHARMHELFERSARRTPDAAALATARGALSYDALNRRANRLARHLRDLGVGPGVLVGLVTNRSFEMVEGMLAIQKAGGAYVPMEPQFPAERIRTIVEDAGLTAVVTTSSIEAGLPALGIPLVRLDADRGRWEDRPDDDLAREGTSSDVAYVIYTSGSTGKPKGVVVAHRSAINLIEWVNQTFGVEGGDRLLFTTSPCFDLSVYDVFGVLAAGGTVRIATEDELEEPRELVRIVVDERITFWDSAPARLEQLAPFFPAGAEGSRLRLVFLSGDWIPVTLPDRVRRAFPGARVIGLGGATEATVWSNWYPVEAVDPAWPSIPYGRPMQNARYYVLDRTLAPCPPGAPGDLYIAGDCLFLGYLNDGARTREKLLPDPFATDRGGLMYSTGDVARYLPDGNMEFLGRKDFQVKVRGYRIELGEIEAVLRRHPAVENALVVAARERGGSTRLVAYVVPRAPVPDAEALLKPHLAAYLPDYMVPTVVAVAAFPLTANGKIDRGALPVPGRSGDERRVRVDPANPTEKALHEIWSGLFDRNDFGVTDDFFALGGHSLLAGRAVVRIQEVLGIELPMVKVLQLPTIAQLAAHVEAAKDTKRGTGRSSAGSAGGDREVGRI